MSDMIRFGIMGSGSIAHKFASAVPLAEGAELIACASRTPGKAEKFAAEFGIPTFYDNYEELLANPDIDCVYIGTTPNFHYECILQCLRAGKHVLCEKPLLSRAADVETVIAELEKTDRFLMEAMWSRFLPSYQDVRKLLRAGELGKVLHVESHFSMRQGPADVPRLYSRALEASAFTDLGIYNYDLTTFLVEEEPDSIETGPGVLYDNIDTECSVLLHFPGEATAFLFCGFRVNTPNTLTAYTDRAKISFVPYFLNPERVEIEYYGGEKKVLEYRFANGFEFEIMEAVRCIRAGKRQSDTHPWAAMLESARLYDRLFAAWGNPWPPRG